MKRILLYVHYNKYDNLSSHVLYQLEKMRPLFDDIFFISNSNLSKSDKDKLEKAELITDFLQRKNSGFDFVAWKDGFQKLGFENVFKNEKRYPEILVEEMKKADFIFLSSEPFPFQQKHIDELQKELLNSKIVLVDGEAFSWYGTHLAKCGEYFFELVKSLD